MPEITPSRYRVDCDWDSVPHLDEKTKQELLAGYEPHMREARSRGIPTMGVGAIYPVPWEEIECKPMQIPAYWPRGYALDVGWNRTAALWGAWDRDTDVLYLVSEHYVAKQVPALHAQAINARGAWQPGLIDPAARGRTQDDGEQLIETYRALGLKLLPADNAVEAGIYAVLGRMETGRLKVFSSLRNLADEHRRYHRDENGKIVKKNDHLMDCQRYMVMGFQKRFITKPIEGADRRTTVHVSDRSAGY